VNPDQLPGQRVALARELAATFPIDSAKAREYIRIVSNALITADTNIVIEANAAEMALLKEAHNFASDHGPLAVEFRDGEVAGPAAEVSRLATALHGMADDAEDGVAWTPEAARTLRALIARL
jgi:hypothetical protein